MYIAYSRPSADKPPSHYYNCMRVCVCKATHNKHPTQTSTFTLTASSLPCFASPIFDPRRRPRTEILPAAIVAAAAAVATLPTCLPTYPR